jgi:hypothetical protein
MNSAASHSNPGDPRKTKKETREKNGKCVTARRNAAHEITDDKPGGLCTLRAVTLITEIQMKFARTSIALAIIIASCNLLGQAAPSPRNQEVNRPIDSFSLGNLPRLANSTRE